MGVPEECRERLKTQQTSKESAETYEHLWISNSNNAYFLLTRIHRYVLHTEPLHQILNTGESLNLNILFLFIPIIFGDSFEYHNIKPLHRVYLYFWKLYL